MTPRQRKLRAVLVSLTLGLALAWIAGESAIRLLLFHPRLKSTGLAQELRQPKRFADGNSEDDYWKLEGMLRGLETLPDAPNHDPIVGWTKNSVAPGSYAHA